MKKGILGASMLGALLLLPLYSQGASLDRARVTVIKCEYNPDSHSNVIVASGKKWKEITFEAYDTKGDLCKRIRLNRDYIIAYTELDESREDGPRALLKAIQPR